MGISRATSLFILYIGQAAMEIANDNKRKTVKESDVLKALEGIYRSLNYSFLAVEPQLHCNLTGLIRCDVVL